ncbi:hypothetical protein ACCO45_005542 [Purpureocillium lilacinum]|uniref:Uncharacterized protein n=1 Tax=Purpureocillium lilacinum TaxID=33203 RepID=A0ACC4DYL8_PURLI
MPQTPRKVFIEAHEAARFRITFSKSTRLLRKTHANMRTKAPPRSLAASPGWLRGWRQRCLAWSRNDRAQQHAKLGHMARRSRCQTAPAPGLGPDKKEARPQKQARRASSCTTGLDLDTRVCGGLARMRGREPPGSLCDKVS